MRRISSSAIWTMLAILVLTACSNTQSNPTASPETGSQPAILRIGWEGSLDSLNPAVALQSTAFTVFDLVYSSLFEFNLDGTYDYDLATNMEISPDNLTYTFTIRSDVVFHDGVPLTAEDVVFSINFYKQHEEFPFMNLYTTPIEHVEAPDGTTVVITLNTVVPSIEY